MNKKVFLVLLILVLFGFGNFLSKALPLSLFSFRGWEILIEEPDALGPFASNQHIVKENSFGDLANMGNLPQLRFYRHEETTTDSCGARNKSISATDVIDGFYFGSSYGAGAGNSDDQVFTEQLKTVSGLNLYNLAGLLTGPEKAKTLAEGFRFGRKMVILEVPERFNRDYFEDLYLNSKPFAQKSVAEGCSGAKARSALETWNRFKKRESRLDIFANQLKRHLQNDVILPNPFVSRVASGELKNGGSKVLFLKEELKELAKSRNPNEITETLLKASEVWKNLGFEVVVLLIPAKVRTYNPYLKEPFPIAVPNYLKEIEKGLRKQGLKVTNLEEPLQAPLAKGLPSYLSDDTHWNPEGIRIGVESFTKTLSSP